MGLRPSQLRFRALLVVDRCRHPSLETMCVATRLTAGDMELLVGRHWQTACANRVSHRARSLIFLSDTWEGRKTARVKFANLRTIDRVSKLEQRARDGEELP